VPGILNWAEMHDIAGLIAPRPLFAGVGREGQHFPIKASIESFTKVREIYDVFGARSRRAGSVSRRALVLGQTRDPVPRPSPERVSDELSISASPDSPTCGLPKHNTQNWSGSRWLESQQQRNLQYAKWDKRFYLGRRTPRMSKRLKRKWRFPRCSRQPMQPAVRGGVQPPTSGTSITGPRLEFLPLRFWRSRAKPPSFRDFVKRRTAALVHPNCLAGWKKLNHEDREDRKEIDVACRALRFSAGVQRFALNRFVRVAQESVFVIQGNRVPWIALSGRRAQSGGPEAPPCGIGKATFCNAKTCQDFSLQSLQSLRKFAVFTGLAVQFSTWLTVPVHRVEAESEDFAPLLFV